MYELLQLWEGNLSIIDYGLTKEYCWAQAVQLTYLSDGMASFFCSVPV